MKRLLLFYIILAFVHSFSAAAAIENALHAKTAYKAPFLKTFHKEDSESLKIGSFERFSFLEKDSNQDFSSEFRFKRKATELKFAELPVPYQNNFYPIQQYSDKDFFGLTNLYSISLHTYLHLYQLF